MAVKSGTYLGDSEAVQTDNTSDNTATVSYSAEDSENVLVAKHLPRMVMNVAKPIIVPLNSTSSPLATDPDTTYAPGSPRVRVTRFT